MSRELLASRKNSCKLQATSYKENQRQRRKAWNAFFVVVPPLLQVCGVGFRAWSALCVAWSGV